MSCYRRFLAILIMLTILTLSMLSGCASIADTFDPYEVPVFSTPSGDLRARSEQIESKLDMSGDSYLSISDIGALSYNRIDSGDHFPIQMTDEEALRQAEEYLNELGLLPKDAYRTHVSRVNQSAIDLTGGKDSQPETIWIYVFNQEKTV